MGRGHAYNRISPSPRPSSHYSLHPSLGAIYPHSPPELLAYFPGTSPLKHFSAGRHFAGAGLDRPFHLNTVSLCSAFIICFLHQFSFRNVTFFSSLPPTTSSASSPKFFHCNRQTMAHFAMSANLHGEISKVKEVGPREACIPAALTFYDCLSLRLWGNNDAVFASRCSDVFGGDTRTRYFLDPVQNRVACSRMRPRQQTLIGMERK